MAALWQPCVSFWRQYRVPPLSLATIAALAVGGLYARRRCFDLAAFRMMDGAPAAAHTDGLSELGYVPGAFWLSLGLLVAVLSTRGRLWPGLRGPRGRCKP